MKEFMLLIVAYYISHMLDVSTIILYKWKIEWKESDGKTDSFYLPQYSPESGKSFRNPKWQWDVVFLFLTIILNSFRSIGKLFSLLKMFVYTIAMFSWEESLMTWHSIYFINHKAYVEKILLYLFIYFPLLDIIVQISTQHAWVKPHRQKSREKQP